MYYTSTAKQNIKGAERTANQRISASELLEVCDVLPKQILGMIWVGLRSNQRCHSYFKENYVLKGL